MLPTSILPFLLFSLLPTALGGLTGDPSLADPNVASTPVDSILHGSFGGPAPLIGKRGLTDTGGLVDRLLSTGDAPLVSTRGLIGTPALLDPNVATTPLGSIIGDAEPVAPLVGKRQTIGACATVGDSSCTASQRARARRSLVAFEKLRQVRSVCPAGEKSCPSGANGTECVPVFEPCQAN